MRYKDDQRYQFQPRHIKVARWLRYRPWSVVRCLWGLARWFSEGAPLNPDAFQVSRWQECCRTWRCWKSIAHIQMGAHWTIDELIELMKARSEE